MNQNMNQKLIALAFSLAMTGTTFAQISDKQPSDKGIGVEAVVEAVNSLPSDLRVPARYALIIGASDYADNRIPDLLACGNDARGLYDVLTDPTIGMFPKEQVTMLVDADVTEDAVVDAIDQLGRRVGPQDLVLVFFSGHGAVDSRGRSYWVMQDTQVDKLRATALPENEITDLFGDIKTTRLVTMIDACYSASTANLGDNKSILDLKNIFPEFDGKGRIAMTASAGDQLSVVIPEGEPGHGYSAFAYHLIQGLGGKADGAGGQSKEGVITVDELWSYVKDRTETTARRAGGEQQPQLKGSFGSRFMLTVNGKQLVAASSLVKTRLTTLKGLFIDDAITAEQFGQGKKLLNQQALDLSETDQKLQAVYVDLVEGRLAAGYLDGALTLIGAAEAKPIIESRKADFSISEVEESNSAEVVVDTDPFEEAMEELVEGLKSRGVDSSIVNFMTQHEHMTKTKFANARSTGGSTPLHFAAAMNASLLLNELISAGADLNAAENIREYKYYGWKVKAGGQSPLHVAVAASAYDAIAVLIKSGANIESKCYWHAYNDSDGISWYPGNATPLHIAVKQNDTIAVRLLLESGADVNAKDSDGDRPLHVAARHNASTVVPLLIEYGADFTIKGQGGRTPLSRAQKKNISPDVAIALIAAGASK